MPVSLTDKVVLITGASSGIGRAAALMLARNGARLALAARSLAKLEALCDAIGRDRALPLQVDLSSPGAVESMVARTLERFEGRIDVLLANAGAHFAGDVKDGEPDDWEQMIAVNVSSVFRAARAVLPTMIARKSGDIIVTSSIAGHQSLPSEAVYSATKFAVQGFVHALRREVADAGIRVGAVAPGTVFNELWGYTDPAAIQARVDARDGLTSEDVAEAIEFMLTRPRHVTIRDLVILPQALNI